ncbi:MAG: LPS assembly protein LptD [Pseudomonadota bacterium]
MRRALVFIVLLLWPGWVLAQDAPPQPSYLVADEVFITENRVLIARGNVEVFQGLVRVQAEEIRYDRVTGELSIIGPIRYRDGEDITVLASAADLDANLRSGILQSAQVVIAEQLQLTAAQMHRVNDRYSQLYKTAVTSCDVCEDGKPPLWQIRAKRIIHDRQEGQLYFDQAQFRIRNIPVAYIPRLRFPDPTVDRARGFLFPSYRATSELGFGLKIPYFIPIGDDRDITVTPYLSSRTTTLELRYRQAFVNGRIQFDTAVSRDDERSGETRGYVFGNGNFRLPNDFGLSFQIQWASDDAYLQNYGISEADRLVNWLSISRAERDEFISGSFFVFDSLRDDEDADTIQKYIADVFYERRYDVPNVGGEFRLYVNGHSHIRPSSDDVIGRDVSRINTEAEYLRGFILPGGVRSEARVGLAGDIFNITQDSSFEQNQTQFTPYTTVAFRYPMTRVTESGATDFLEPIAQLAWTGSSQLNIPNEESTLVDFDDGNLLALSRFPAPDRRERGTVGAFGVNWSRVTPSGWEGAMTLGQVFRNEADEDFTRSSGLSGTESDYLIAGQLRTLNGLAFTARTLFDSSFDFTKAEVLGQYVRPKMAVSGSYIWLIKDEVEGRSLDTSEIYLDGRYNVSDSWVANADWRYDMVENRSSTAGLSLVYFNECVEVDFSVRRRYTSSSSLEPSTSFGLTIGLRGFSARTSEQTTTKSCG